MNALTQAAKHSAKREALINYAIAVSAGLILGVMFGMGV